MLSRQGARPPQPHRQMVGEDKQQNRQQDTQAFHTANLAYWHREKIGTGLIFRSVFGLQVEGDECDL
jgi:hypothetical protein